MEKTHKGWIFVNGGIPVYPTLCRTKKDCLEECRKSYGKDWEEVLLPGIESGFNSIKKVELTVS